MTQQNPEPNPAPGAAGAPQEPAPQTTPPPWGDDANFDADKAKKLISDLRADKEKLSAREVLTDDQKAKLAEYDKWAEASKTEAQRQAEELNRWQSQATQWRDQAVAARIQALATTNFADPSDAVGALDAGKYLDSGGQIDEAAIKADLAALLEQKPHWGRPSDGSTTQAPRVPLPNLVQGAGGTPTANPAAEFAAIFQSQLR